MRTPEELVMDVENNLDYPLGPGITNVLVEFVKELDKRYRVENNE